jgi:hypothetical protein
MPHGALPIIRDPLPSLRLLFSQHTQTTPFRSQNIRRSKGSTGKTKSQSHNAESGTKRCESGDQRRDRRRKCGAAVEPLSRTSDEALEIPIERVQWRRR